MNDARNLLECISNGANEFLHTVSGNSGNGVKFEFPPSAEISKSVETRAIRRGVQLRGNNDHRFFDQGRAEGFQLAVDDLERMDGIVGVGIARVYEMNEEPRALDVPEETDAEARAQVRAFNQTGKISNDKSASELAAMPTGAAVGIDNAEIGLECGERIIRNFGPRRGNHGNQRRLTRIGVANQADIGEQFQLQAKMPLLAGKSIFMFARGLVPRLGKMLIAASTAPPMGDQYALAGRSKIGDGGAALIVKGKRADGHLQDHVLARMAGAVGAFAVASAIGLEFTIVTVSQQRVVVWVGFKINVAAMAAVTAGGTASRNIFFAPESDAAVAAVAGLHENFGFINEHWNKTP